MNAIVNTKDRIITYAVHVGNGFFLIPEVLLKQLHNHVLKMQYLDDYIPLNISHYNKIMHLNTILLNTGFSLIYLREYANHVYIKVGIPSKPQYATKRNCFIPALFNVNYNFIGYCVFDEQYIVTHDVVNHVKHLISAYQILHIITDTTRDSFESVKLNLSNQSHY